MKDRIAVIFRYDDFSGESSINLESEILETFHEYAIPLTVGVTPLVTAGEVDDPTPCANIPLGDQKILLLRRAVQTLGTEIALHGISHQTIRHSTWGGCTEFEGLASDAQLERIRRGKHLLEGLLETSVLTFIPPWNSYDDNTLQAVYESGIETVSGDVGGLAPPASSLHFVPTTCVLSRLQPVIRWARITRDPAPIVTVVLHPYDFSRNAKPRPMTIDILRDRLGWLRRQKDVKAYTITGLKLRGDDLSAMRLRKCRAARSSYWYRILPERAIRDGVYHSFSELPPSKFAR